MGTIANKVLFMIVFGVVSWIGMRGLLVNYYASSLKTFDIHELEKEGIGSERFLEVTNGIATNDFAFLEGLLGVNVLYPLISAEAKQQMLQSEQPVEVKVLVLRTDVDSGCVYNNSCSRPGGVAIKGVVSLGAKKAAEEMGFYKAAFEGGSIKLAPDVIVLEEHDPISWYWNLLMFVGGTFLSLNILRSFFQKADGVEDWFYKVAEMDDSRRQKLRRQKELMNM